MSSREILIMDSSVLVALVKINDADHQRATTIMNRTLTTSNLEILIPLEVLAESLNIIGKKEGKHIAIQSGKELLLKQEAGELAFVASQTSTLQLALELQATATGGPSFIDCLVMATADEHDTPYILGFDACFAKNDYKLPG